MSESRADKAARYTQHIRTALTMVILQLESDSDPTLFFACIPGAAQSLMQPVDEKHQPADPVDAALMLTRLVMQERVALTD